MKKMINTVNLTGYLYAQDLKKMEVKNKDSKRYGQEFIKGTISIATDEDGLNVVPINYLGVYPITNQGKVNNTYTLLNRIYNQEEVWTKVGKENCLKVKANSAIELDDFYTENGDLVSRVRVGGGFLSTIPTFSDNESLKNQIEVDYLINGVSDKLNIDEEIIGIDLRGAIFNFRGDLLPVTMTVSNPQGVEYFQSLEPSPSEPVFIKVHGKVVNTTISTVTEEESKWGEALVKKTTKTTREFLVTGSNDIYDLGDKNILTMEEVEKAVENRNIYLATKKQQREDYDKSKKSDTSATVATPLSIKKEGFPDF